MKRAFDKIADVTAIRQALVEGEQSGEPEPFDFGAFKQRKAAQQSFRSEIQKAKVSR